MRFHVVLASVAVLCYGACDVLHLPLGVREQISRKGPPSYHPHLIDSILNLAAGGASASKQQDIALDACGLPTDYRQTSHCFADSTHHTCCMLGPEGVVEATAHPSPSTRHNTQTTGKTFERSRDPASVSPYVGNKPAGSSPLYMPIPPPPSSLTRSRRIASQRGNTRTTLETPSALPPARPFSPSVSRTSPSMPLCS